MLEEHWAYARDSVRSERYRKAIGQVVSAGDVVLDLGCGVGVLGLFSLEAGAGRVVGIERTALAEVAQETLRRAAGAGRVQVIRGMSDEVTLDAPVDVIVCDHVGYFGIDYQVIAVLRDARRRFLKPGGRIVPAALTLCLGLVESEHDRARVMRWEDASVPEALRWLSHYDVNRRHAATLSEPALLAEPATLGEIDLMTEERDFFSFRARFAVARAGEVHGLAGWFDCRLAEGVSMTNSPLAAERIDRPQALLPLAEPLAVAAGDAVEASVALRPSDGLIAWSVSHPASGKSLRHSTWEGSLLDLDDVRRVRPEHVPRMNDRGRARQVVLGYCDGRRTVQEIEAAVLRDHPDLMPTPEAISGFVAEVLGRDTH